MNQVVIEETSFEEVLSEIEENSKYKRLPPKEKTWMTVPEIGNLLGLKKTGRYWLVQKNYFECREIAGQMRVNIASFEKWYANQVKYHKVNGEEPGKNLKKWSYSISEVAKMLGISETTVYDLIRRDGIKTVTVDYWIRIPKKSFQEWYEKQSKYRTQKDREKDKELEGATITMPEMARLLGIPRRQVYEILKNSKYSHFFETIEIAELEKAVTGYEQSQKSAEKFIALIDKYENFDTLTNTMLNEFVEKILVHERARKGSQDTTQEIEIYFNFLGRYIPPSLQPVPLTPEEQEELRKKEERKDRLHQNYLKRKASGAQKRYEDKIKAQKKAEMDAKKALIRAEDMKKGVFSTIGQLPKEEPRKGSISSALSSRPVCQHRVKGCVDRSASLSITS